MAGVGWAKRRSRQLRFSFSPLRDDGKPFGTAAISTMRLDMQLSIDRHFAHYAQTVNHVSVI